MTSVNVTDLKAKAGEIVELVANAIIEANSGRKYWFVSEYLDDDEAAETEIYSELEKLLAPWCADYKVARSTLRHEILAQNIPSEKLFQAIFFLTAYRNQGKLADLSQVAWEPMDPRELFLNDGDYRTAFLDLLERCFGIHEEKAGFLESDSQYLELASYCWSQASFAKYCDIHRGMMGQVENRDELSVWNMEPGLEFIRNGALRREDGNGGAGEGIIPDAFNLELSEPDDDGHIYVSPKVAEGWNYVLKYQWSAVGSDETAHEGTIRSQWNFWKLLVKSGEPFASLVENLGMAKVSMLRQTIGARRQDVKNCLKAAGGILCQVSDEIIDGLSLDEDQSELVDDRIDEFHQSLTEEADRYFAELERQKAKCELEANAVVNGHMNRAEVLNDLLIKTDVRLDEDRNEFAARVEAELEDLRTWLDELVRQVARFDFDISGKGVDVKVSCDMENAISGKKLSFSFKTGMKA